MQLLILGGSGRLGKHLLEVAIHKGHTVRALVRDPKKIRLSHDRLEIIQGNPLDEELLNNLVTESDGILSALNISRKSDFPWSGLRTPETLLSDVMQKVIACGSDQTRRLVVCSAWGVAGTRKDLPGWFRWVVDNSNVGAAYRDHERQEKLIQESTFKWTIVQPVGLTNSNKDRSVRVSYNNDPKPGLLISRKATAKFMIDALEDTDLVSGIPVISF